MEIPSWAINILIVATTALVGLCARLIVSVGKRMQADIQKVDQKLDLLTEELDATNDIIVEVDQRLVKVETRLEYHRGGGNGAVPAGNS